MSPSPSPPLPSPRSRPLSHRARSELQVRVKDQGLNEGLAEHVEHVELRKGRVVVVERRQEEHVLAPDLVFGVEAACDVAVIR
jgi:hypothetical protein